MAGGGTVGARGGGGGSGGLPLAESDGLGGAGGGGTNFGVDAAAFDIGSPKEEGRLIVRGGAGGVDKGGFGGCTP